MSVYVPKYRLEWVDYFGQDAQLLIDEQESVGGSYTDIKGTRSPITLTYDTPSDYLLEPVNGSMMTIRLVAQTDFQFEELYTNNNRKWRVTFNIDSTLFWQGFILPDQYQEEYKGPPYVNEFIAADQLGYLKTLAWDDLGLTSPKNDIQILETVLGATDLEFDLQEGINVYETNHSSTSADSPLDQTYTDVNVFDGKTYYDVLYHTLHKYQAIIKQRAGEWFIYRPREATAAFNLRKWTLSLGAYTYDSVQSYNAVVSTTAATVSEANLVRIPGDGSMWRSPAWSRYTMTHNLATKASFIENHDFTQWYTSPVTPKWWTEIGTVTQGRIGNKLAITAQTAAPGSNYFIQAKTLDDASGSQCIQLYFDFEIYLYTSHTMVVNFEFQFDNAKWYDPDSTSWSNTRKYISRSYTETSGVYSQRQRDTIEIHTPAITGFTPNLCYMYIHTPTATSVADILIVNEARATVKHYASSTDTRDFDEEVDESGVIEADNVYKPDDIELLVGDAPFTPNAGEIYDGVLFLNGGKSACTSSWTADGRTSTLINLMKSNFSDFFQYTQQVLSVKIYTKSIDGCTVLREINNTTTANKYFMIKRASYEQQKGYWEVEAHQLIWALHEVVSPGDAKILLETGDKILLETGDEIIRE